MMDFGGTQILKVGLIVVLIAIAGIAAWLVLSGKDGSQDANEVNEAAEDSSKRTYTTQLYRFIVQFGNEGKDLQKPKETLLRRSFSLRDSAFRAPLCRRRSGLFMLLFQIIQETLEKTQRPALALPGIRRTAARAPVL